MQFTETYKGIWESDKQQIVACAICRDENGKDTGKLLKSTEAMYRIRETEKGFQIHITLFGGRKQYLKTKKTFNEAVKFIVKYDANK